MHLSVKSVTKFKLNGKKRREGKKRKKDVCY